MDGVGGKIRINHSTGKTYTHSAMHLYHAVLSHPLTISSKHTTKRKQSWDTHPVAGNDTLKIPGSYRFSVSFHCPTFIRISFGEVESVMTHSLSTAHELIIRECSHDQGLIWSPKGRCPLPDLALEYLRRKVMRTILGREKASLLVRWREGSKGDQLRWGS